MGIRLTQFLGWDKGHHQSSSPGLLEILFQLSLSIAYLPNLAVLEIH
jgi:hypothetical protein